MADEKLKPCPFCGRCSKEDLKPVVQEIRESQRFYVKCAYCDIKGIDASTKEGAINWWNNRADTFDCPCCGKVWRKGDTACECGAKMMYKEKNTRAEGEKCEDCVIGVCFDEGSECLVIESDVKNDWYFKNKTPDFTHCPNCGRKIK